MVYLSNLNSNFDASHLASISKIDFSLSRVSSSSNQVNQDVRNLRNGGLNSWFSSVGSGVERKHTFLTLGDMSWAHEGVDGLSSQELINVIFTIGTYSHKEFLFIMLLPGSNVKAINFKTGDGQGNESLLLQIKLESGSHRDWLIESEGSKNADGFASVDLDWEWLNNYGVNGSWLVGSIWNKI